VSKAFTKDEAWEEPIIPPRPPVPAGVPNYVTPRGLGLLRAELAELEAERHRLEADRSDEVEYRRLLAILAGRTSELTARIASAALVDPRGRGGGAANPALGRGRPDTRPAGEAQCLTGAMKCYAKSPG